MDSTELNHLLLLCIFLLGKFLTNTGVGMLLSSY